MTPNQLAELRKLEAAATPGPWEEGGPYPWCTVIVCVDGGNPGYYDAPEPPTYEPVCVVHQPPEGDFETPPPAQSVADMRFIATIRNAAPDLLRAAEVVAACERWRPLSANYVEQYGGWVATHRKLDQSHYLNEDGSIRCYATFAEAVLAAAKWLEEREGK